MTIIEQKRRAAEAALAHVKDGMVLGVGTGSTVDIFIDLLAAKVVAEKVSILTVPSSFATEQRLRAAGFQLKPLNGVSEVPLVIDGADEVDKQLALIKGGGAALLREKILAEAASELIIIVDNGKLVPQLGKKMPVPLEVLPAAFSLVTERIRTIGGSPSLRQAERKAGPVITDNGNFIIDAKFPGISNPVDMEKRLNAIPGVLDNGLFPNQADIVYVGEDKGVKRLQ